MRVFHKLMAMTLATLMLGSMAVSPAFATDTDFTVTGTDSTTLVKSQSPGVENPTKSASNSTTIHASTTTDGVEPSTKTYAAYGITYTVVIPQSITLEPSNKNAGSGNYAKDFDITATGNIGTALELTVTPDSSVSLTASGYAKDNATCSITKKTGNNYYSRDDLLKTKSDTDLTVVGTTTTYTASADLTPGDYNGYMDVSIKLDYTATHS
jgi:hypothetical protein